EPHLERLFAEALGAFAPDVVHIQELASLPASLIDVTRRHGVPTLMTLQNYFPLCPTVYLYDADGEVCRREWPGETCVRCCAGGDVLVAMSHRVEEMYRERGVESRTVHLTLGHLDELRPRAIETPPAPVVFATLQGALSPQKGSRVLAEAVKRLDAMQLRYRL